MIAFKDGKIVGMSEDKEEIKNIYAINKDYPRLARVALDEPSQKYFYYCVENNNKVSWGTHNSVAILIREELTYGWIPYYNDVEMTQKDIYGR